MANKNKADAQLYQFKITLKDAPVPIWRRIHVSSTENFLNLHTYIQDAMGWYNYHMFTFEKDRGKYLLVDSEESLADYGNDLAANINLYEVFTAEKDKMLYTYDMGDNWEHEVVLEKILPLLPSTPHPVCIGGKGKCPPEDCGGVWGYADLLEILKDPKHPEYDAMCEWIDIESGDDWDPNEFELEAE
ncbi:MAG: plasmid pRiA4b ORF-3 family protein [Microscillaceae bacterium]|jgi:hypothetical protein|nr:plasmid pRiA4b ORF-3 family protein [Microscillaceae bacterium]